MDLSRSIRLPRDLIDRCAAWGKRVVDRGLDPHSLALSARGAEHDPIVWAEGKMAECIFAIHFGLDPLTSLNWSGGAELNGIDIIIESTTVDVKQTQPGNALLIWSYGKGREARSQDRSACVGGVASHWITRPEFLKERIIVKANEPCRYRLNVGTQYMHERDLWDMDCFHLAQIARRRAA